MESMIRSGQPRFRLWLATYDDDWQPAEWNDVPPRAVAIEPIDTGLYSESEAALFAASFNTAMLQSDRRLWAVAVPVTVRYDGDAQAGRPVVGHVFRQAASAGETSELPTSDVSHPA